MKAVPQPTAMPAPYAPPTAPIPSMGPTIPDPSGMGSVPRNTPPTQPKMMQPSHMMPTMTQKMGHIPSGM